MSIAGLLLVLAFPAHALSPSAAGDVTLTEFQADTTRVPQYYGEWFELYNNAGGTLDFDGVSITNSAGQVVTVTSMTTVGVGGYLVFGINEDRTYGSATYNGNIPVDYLYTFASFNMSLSDDTLTVRYGGTVLDVVDWTSAWGISSNYAHSASLNAYNLEWANDYSINWCSSATFIADSGMYGSPGEENEYCGTSAGADNDGDGYSEREGDCRDDDANIHPGSLDGNDGVPQSSGGGGNANDDADCDGDRDDGIEDNDLDGYTEVDGDCNDAVQDVFPGAMETGDGVDNDCNDCIDDEDEDGDGYGYSASDSCGDDCSPSLDSSVDPDLPADRDADVHPGATEIPYDGYDQDCDGLDLCDYDEDGYKSDLCDCGARCDCDDNNSAINPGAIENVSDGIDNDCDDEIDIPDRDGDGVTAEDGDCMDIAEPAELKDVSATVFPEHDGKPAAEEKCGDLLDNDCDGFYDNLPECTNPAAYATVRGGGLCGVSPATGGSGVLALGALMGLVAAARRREGGAR
ncbi:MAG: MopE-related protein [Pseudomonadota bacterium]|nr:MopE-related protein [Pseudomonadota bacterium]